MPRRNLLLIVVVAAASLLCYSRVQHGRYAWRVAEALTLIRRNYVEEVDDQKLRSLYESALNGMVDGLGDPNAHYFPPALFKQFRQQSIDHEVEGVGILLNRLAEGLTVLAPIVGGPAHRAGIRSDDRIIAIDGQSTDSMDVNAAIDRIKGEPESQVVLTIGREGAAQFDATVVRERVSAEVVRGFDRRSDGSWNYFLPDDPRIKYVDLDGFGTRTADELRAVLARFKEANDLGALVLDLRGNPGGMLEQAVAVSDLLISSGRIVSVAGRRRPERVFEARSAGTLSGFPIAVLIDSGSASASEIVAACLQDHKRAILVGTQTHGKGSVQELLELEGGASRLKITTAFYLRPNGRNIQRNDDNQEDRSAWGVRPNDGYEVELNEEQRGQLRDAKTDRLRFGDHVRRDDPPHVDPQLARAVEYLQSQIRGR
jgi:carboxyl-terminal processing protease